jgi:hypothetical protein
VPAVIRTALIGLAVLLMGCPVETTDDDDTSVADDDATADDDDDDDTGTGDDDDSWGTADEWSMIALGLFHGCAIRGDGVLTCWGKNESGQSDHPTEGRFRHVALGHEHSCAIREDRSVTCWGCLGEDVGNLGQCEAPPGDFVHLDAGEQNSCGLTTGGEMVCWGGNNGGQNDVQADDDYVHLATYYGHTCGIHEDGSMDCWGEGLWGQLEIPDGTFMDVGVADWTTYALRPDGEFICFGHKDCDDAEGRLWSALSVYTTATCALSVGGVPDCFGYNVGGRNTEPDGLLATQVEAGHNFSCAIGVDGEIVCWGCGDCPDDPSNQGVDCGDFGQCEPPSPGDL